MKTANHQMLSYDIFCNQHADALQTDNKDAARNTGTLVAPLKSWDIHCEQLQRLYANLSLTKELSELNLLAGKFGWKNDLSAILNSQHYEALVVTTLEKHILWVNQGFTAMTGYSKKFALHKKPSFLQGRKTNNSERQKIRKKLALQQPFKQVLTNYKKDGTPYACELHIFPLYNDATTHYLALERIAS